jgi:endoglucanase
MNVRLTALSAVVASALAWTPVTAAPPQATPAARATKPAPTKPASATAAAGLRLNDLEYLEMPGINVMLAHDYYPEGHQGGVGIIQNGLRVATNGDLRLDRTPGQWQPIPKVGKRVIDRATGEISLHAEYPDDARNRKGFNPIDYPDLKFGYTIRVRPEGAAIRVTIDLDAPLPAGWDQKVGFNFELFPGLLFGKTFQTERGAGIFPRQANGPGTVDATGAYQPKAMATGRRLVIAPESDRQRLVIRNDGGTDLELVDGRGQHTNGWFVVRSLVTPGATKQAINWLITPHALPGFIAPPVVQVSQVGYHPAQQKWAIIELDRADTKRQPVVVARLTDSGALETVLSKSAEAWGRFLRFDYLRLDFTAVNQPGMYVVRYGTVQTAPFRIAADVFTNGVWQPTLEYFLPVQMCHMRVNDRYRVWHDVCHVDDARMAPTDLNHFDGYVQGPSTLTTFKPGEHVPGLDRGGWHDAGDDDLRVESQASTVQGLAQAFEAFGDRYDNTTIDQAMRVVEIQKPDGKPDLLQQIEHGVLTVAGGYRALGRFYRGIITPTLRQYAQVGDFGGQTDNVVFDQAKAGTNPPPVGTGVPGSPDDRWVFTEQNPRRELAAAAGLAAAARVLKGYNDPMAADALTIAEAVWKGTPEPPAPNFPRAPQGAPAMPRQPRPSAKLGLAVELLATTKDRAYAEFILGQSDLIVKNFRETGWVVGPVLPLIGDAGFTAAMTEAARAYRADVIEREKKTPYGVPYEPDIWGAGWNIQKFGMQQYFLHTAFPEVFPKESMLNALNFILGSHPGPNTSSFVSGVGARSVLQGYGLNRADWSYIPGGSVSGTALIRPDFPELLEWPYLWQQTEYVLGGGTTDYLFLVQAADHLLNDKH